MQNKLFMCIIIIINYNFFLIKTQNNIIPHVHKHYLFIWAMTLSRASLCKTYIMNCDSK